MCFGSWPEVGTSILRQLPALGINGIKIKVEIVENYQLKNWGGLFEAAKYNANYYEFTVLVKVHII